jgi:hypothetical protein
LALGCGLCLNNAIAVLRGLRLRGGEFVRTPKSGSEHASRKRSSYAVAHSHLWMVEIALGIYSFASFLIYFRHFHRAFSLFLLIYAIGFCVTGWASRPRRATRRAGSLRPVGTIYGTSVRPLDTAADG